MFKRMLQNSSGQGPARASSEEFPAADAGLPALPAAERSGIEPPPNNVDPKLSSFEELYRQSTFRSTTSAEWNVLKVADMLNSEHLRGLSSASKHSALLMALEAAGVAVEDILQDAVQRQRLLTDYEETQQRRFAELESGKVR